MMNDFFLNIYTTIRFVCTEKKRQKKISMILFNRNKQANKQKNCMGVMKLKDVILIFQKIRFFSIEK